MPAPKEPTREPSIIVLVLLVTVLGSVAILAIFTGYKPDDQIVNIAITPAAFSLHKDWEKKTTQLTPDGVTTLEVAIFSVTNGTAQEKMEAATAILTAS